MKLKDKVVVITGSSSNIGEATAKLFAKHGSRIVVNCKTNEEGAGRVVREIKWEKGEAFYVKADLSKEPEVKAFFNKVIKKYKKVDVLINNAGHGHDKDIFEATKEDWYKAIDDCLITAVLCSKYFGKAMLDKKSGVILNTSSIRGVSYAGREGLIAYSAAKAALINFTMTLAKRLAPNVRVNAIAPGFVYKPMYDKFPKELTKKLLGSTLLKRYNTVDEIAEGFLYLATADGVTGEVLNIDGGFLLKQE
jgi:NAD(P)-dependent dehydrogenase (short-subunit alcohol dehydrogenase family)